MTVSSDNRSAIMEFITLDVPPDRALVVDGGILGSKRHVIYGLVEADVTKVAELRRCQPKSARFSYSAYFIACLARAVEANPKVQGYHTRGGKRLMIYRDVDVSTMIEFQEGTTATPHVIRKANKKSVQEISDEIMAVKTNPETSEQYSGKFAKLAPKLPRCVRMAFFRMLKGDPRAIQRNCGTVMFTSIGMFGKGHGGWGLTYMPLHTMGVTVGGIQSKPAVVVDGDSDSNGDHVGGSQVRIVPRDFVSLTLSFDHDVVDGAPAARFARQFLDLIESASLLEESKEEGEGRGTTNVGTK